jgi:DNA-binding MarR family transcriptional regulator
MAELTEKEQIVLDAMRQAGKPVRPGDIATMTGLKSDEVSKIIKSLQKKGLVVSPKRCVYEPSQ